MMKKPIQSPSQARYRKRGWSKVGIWAPKEWHPIIREMVSEWMTGLLQRANIPHPLEQSKSKRPEEKFGLCAHCGKKGGYRFTTATTTGYRCHYCHHAVSLGKGETYSDALIRFHQKEEK